MKSLRRVCIYCSAFPIANTCLLLSLGIVAAVATLRAAVSDFFSVIICTMRTPLPFHFKCAITRQYRDVQLSSCASFMHTHSHTKQCVMHEEMKIKYSYRACTKWDSLKMKIGYSHIENMCKRANRERETRHWHENEKSVERRTSSSLVCVCVRWHLRATGDSKAHITS